MTARKIENEGEPQAPTTSASTSRTRAETTASAASAASAATNRNGDCLRERAKVDEDERGQGRNLHSILRRGENQKMKKNETAKKAKNKTSGGLRKSNSASECNESDLLQPREEERNKKKKRFSTALTELWPSSSDQQQQQQQQFPSGAFRLEGNSISFRKEGDGKNENGDEDHHNNAGKQQKCTKWTKSCSPSPRCRPTSLNLNAAPSPKKLKMCRMEMNKCCKKKKDHADSSSVAVNCNYKETRLMINGEEYPPPDDEEMDDEEEDDDDEIAAKDITDGLAFNVLIGIAIMLVVLAVGTAMLYAVQKILISSGQHKDAARVRAFGLGGRLVDENGHRIVHPKDLSAYLENYVEKRRRKRIQQLRHAKQQQQQQQRNTDKNVDGKMQRGQTETENRRTSTLLSSSLKSFGSL